MVCLLKVLGAESPGVGRAAAFRGDSVSALTWLDKQTHRGGIAYSAAALLSLVVVRHEVQITEVIHILGKFNTRCDDLSRGRSMSEVLPGVRDWELEGDTSVAEILRLCNPHRVAYNTSNFEGFWEAASNFVTSLSPSIPSLS